MARRGPKPKYDWKFTDRVIVRPAGLVVLANGDLPTLCWCERCTVRVDPKDVFEGRTESCGHVDCQSRNCSWCGEPIVSYAAHFQTWAGKPCKTAALVEQPVQMLDGNLTRDQIRRRALRDLKKTAHRDRLEQPGIATYARNDRRGRS